MLETLTSVETLTELDNIPGMCQSVGNSKKVMPGSDALLLSLILIPGRSDRKFKM